MKIEYKSNNSGGSWWLKDEDWIALEKEGWNVVWCKNDKSNLSSSDRWLGALATSATKEFETPLDAIKEFEKITGQDTTDEGCNCCGAPHMFSWEDKTGNIYISGSDCLKYLFPNKEVKSIRKLMEEEK